MAAADTSRETDELEDHKAEFDRAKEAWSQNYDWAVDDFKFARWHQHWPEQIEKQRKDDGRPCLTIPKLPPLIRQVVNDGRQNKPAITVSPADDASDPDTAEIMNGLIRQIERASHADIAYDTALDCAVTGGFGFWRINTQYSSDDSFEQDIVIEAIENPFSILPDPDDKSATSLNWNSCFELDEMRKAAFEEEYDGAEPVSFDGVGSTTVAAKAGETVKIARRWVRTKTKRMIVALSPPLIEAQQANPEAAKMAAELIPESMIVDLKVYEDNKGLFDVLGVKIVGQPRAVPSYAVKRYTLSGADVLDTLDWAGKYIPIVAVFGDDVNVEGERRLEGLVRPAKDAQRMFNYWRSASTELVALAPKAPFIGRAGQFVSDASKWATANVQSHAYIEYDVPEGSLDASAPQRQPFAGVPAGALQEALNASDDMKAITGIYDASLGARSNETSGKAIRARQMEGDTGTFHYIDNLTRAIRTAGEILLDLIPKTYSTKRVVRILGPDLKTVERVPINQPVQTQEPGENGQMVEIQRIYDLSAGKYDLSVTAGPSYTSRREEAASQMIEFIRAFPPAAPIIGDLLAQNLDWPGADEVAERLKALLPAQLQGDSPQAQEAQAQMKKMAEIIGELKGQLAAAKADKSLDMRRVEIDAYEAETGRLKAVIPKGAPYDAAAMESVISQSLTQLLNSPDILEVVNAGAPPEQIAQMLAQRMAPQPQEQQPQPIAA